MEQIIEMLTPWAKPVMVFCGFMLVRYIYRTVILRFLMLLNNKMSFEYGGDIRRYSRRFRQADSHLFVHPRRLCGSELLAHHLRYRPPFD